MTDIVAVAAIGALVSMQTAWLHYQVNKNACGGAKCIKVMQDAIKPLRSAEQRQE